MRGVAESINTDEIQMIETRVRRGSALAAALGAAGGLWLGSALALGLGFDVRCQPSCGAVEAGIYAR
jgi:hypothetical protein